MIIYHRSKRDVQKLLRGRMKRFKALLMSKKGEDLSTLADVAMEAYGNMRQLGILGRIQRDCIWVSRILDRKAMKFKVDRGILDDMSKNGILEDSAKKEVDFVVIYGRLEKGVVVEAAALNLHSLPGYDHA